LATVVQVLPSRDRCTAYLSIDAAPELDGTIQLSVATVFPGTAAVDRGAVGAPATAPTTELGALQPTLLWARTT
jgi:hypothetical protein